MNDKLVIRIGEGVVITQPLPVTKYETLIIQKPVYVVDRQMLDHPEIILVDPKDLKDTHYLITGRTENVDLGEDTSVPIIEDGDGVYNLGNGTYITIEESNLLVECGDDAVLFTKTFLKFRYLPEIPSDVLKDISVLMGTRDLNTCIYNHMINQAQASSLNNLLLPYICTALWETVTINTNGDDGRKTIILATDQFGMIGQKEVAETINSLIDKLPKYLVEATGIKHGELLENGYYRFESLANTLYIVRKDRPHVGTACDRLYVLNNDSSTVIPWIDTHYPTLKAIGGSMCIMTTVNTGVLEMFGYTPYSKMFTKIIGNG